jgi:3-oxoacyl-[acyl-carrier-protein] synthase II
MMPERDVVITGLGPVSPIGIGRDPFWAALAAQRSGVAIADSLVQIGFPVTIGGEVKDFDGKEFVTPRKSLKVMCREIQLAYAAAILATRDAGLAPGTIDPDRFGCVLGSDMYYFELESVEEIFRSAIDEHGFDFDRWGPNFPSKVFPLWMLKYLPNMAACHIGIALDARGPNNTITLGDASPLLAISEAATVIARGHADVMLAGGTGSRLNITPLTYRGVGNLSHHQEDPAAASRPFDARRDGLVNGEGAAAIILESRAHAEARGATILARVLACRSGFEPRPDGAQNTGRAWRQVLRGIVKEAGLAPANIGHVNAHGLGTRADDAIEAQAIHDILGDVPVTALKSYFGTLGTGGGAVELIGSVLALAQQEVPVTLNYETPDPQCPVNVVRGVALRNRPATALCINQSGTGQVAAVLLGGM